MATFQLLSGGGSNLPHILTGVPRSLRSLQRAGDGIVPTACVSLAPVPHTTLRLPHLPDPGWRNRGPAL